MTDNDIKEAKLRIKERHFNASTQAANTAHDAASKKCVICKEEAVPAPFPEPDAAEEDGGNDVNPGEGTSAMFPGQVDGVDDHLQHPHQQRHKNG